MSFADSFWTADYHSGHEALFDELYEGVKENDDFVALFTKRMDAEFRYGQELENGPTSLKLLSKRHANDDYVSTIKNAFGEIGHNFTRQGAYHTEIAQNIQDLVLQPFTKWCKEHEQRIGFSEQVIAEKYKQYSGSRAHLEKIQKKYFNKCRLVEDLKTHYSEEELDALDVSQESVDGAGSAEDSSTDVTYTFGGFSYEYASAQTLLAEMVTQIEISPHKVPILGTYNNVSTGSAIAQWLLDNMPEMRGSVAKAELFGQDLIANGFLRAIGSMANKNFINSAQFHYQWKPAVFELAKVSELELAKKSGLDVAANRGNQFSTYIEDMKQAIGVAAVDYNDKSQYRKLVKEVDLLDAQYYESAKILDLARCEFEETVMDHLAFMQKCELDRLRAVKKATFDFIAAFSNKISALKQSCDKLLLVEETIHPAGDLKFLIENYATGKFSPHVTLYDNYYHSNIRQTFGVDLNVKARLDKKAVPLIVQAVLSYLDSLYPELENDEERVGLWTKPVHLAKVHQLRQELNEQTELSAIQGVLAAHDPSTVTNALKLYFMELPDSIVSHTFFDLIKTLYSSYPPGTTAETSADKSRVTGLQNTLMELPVCNLATLDALLTHLNRLVQIISSKNAELSESLLARLSREFGALVLRPKTGAAEIEGKSVHAFNTATEALQQNFIADLFTHKETIFGELRRRNSKKPSRTNSAKSAQAPQKSKLSNSKIRLESKLKSAVKNASSSSNASNDHSATKNEPMKKEVEADLPPIPRPTTPPLTPSKTPGSSGGSALKRSTSPNKKKLNAYLEKRSDSTASSRSRPSEGTYSSNTSDDESKSRGAEQSENMRGSKHNSQRESSPSPKERKMQADVIVVD
ncbi:hypothetical protein OXX69_000442 [Metschnikowia pulcherrima]